MRALVTGASGFIGRHVVDALLAAGAEVRAFDRAPLPDPAPLPDRLPSGTNSIEFVSGDVLDPDAVRAAIDGCDTVFHLAAVYSYARSDAALMQAVNVTGTRNVIDAALRGSKQRRVVHTSSCATCGPVPGRAATECDHPAARDLRVPYKRTKLEGERLALRAAREGGSVVVVNPTVPIGPGDERPTPTGKMVDDVAAGRARGYLARSALNIVAVEDVAAGHLLALEHGRTGERYLLGGENVGMRELFAAIAVAAGRTAPRIAVPWVLAYAAAQLADVAMRPTCRQPELLVLDEVIAGRLPHLFDDAKARTELGYISRPFEEAVRAALAPTPAPEENRWSIAS
jgi:dihydroflavonol-4-reductase